MLLDVDDKPTIVDSGARRMDGEVTRAARNRTLPIEHTDLDFIRIDHQARLQFGEVEIVIECPFVVTLDGVAHRLDPRARGDLGPLLAVYPASLSVAYISEAAALHLEFDSGATIVVAADADYEAWQVCNGRRSLIACLPGTTGDIAEWTF
jgi:hypothetical protein